MSIKTKFLLLSVGLFFVSSTILFASSNSAEEALSKGKKLYADGRYEEAMDSFVDVFVSGNPDQISEANEYVNLIHFERGGVVPPKQVPYDKAIEDRQNIGVQGKNLFDKEPKKAETTKQPKEDPKTFKEVFAKEKVEDDIPEPPSSVPEANPFAKPEEPAETVADNGTKAEGAKDDVTDETGKGKKSNKNKNVLIPKKKNTTKSGKQETQTPAKTDTATVAAASAATSTKGASNTGTKSTSAKPQKHPKATKAAETNTVETNAAPSNNQESTSAVVPAVVVGGTTTGGDTVSEAQEPKTQTAATTKGNTVAAATNAGEDNAGAVAEPEQTDENLSQIDKEREAEEKAKAEAKEKARQEKEAAKAKKKQEKAEAKAKKKQEKELAKAKKKQEKTAAAAEKKRKLSEPKDVVVNKDDSLPTTNKYKLRSMQQEKENEQRQKMRDELLTKLKKKEHVQVYMRDGKVDAIDIPSDILFNNRMINKNATEIMDYVYGLMVVENPNAYYVLPEGSFTDDITVQNVRQAVSLHSYLMNRGISPAKMHLNMGLSNQEPPEKFRNLAGTAIVFDYKGKANLKPTRLQEKKNLPPALSLAVAPFEEIIPEWDETFLIDFSVMETASPIKKWTLQIISNDVDGHFYVLKQYSGKTVIANQFFWNGRKRYLGQPLPLGNYTIVLWAMDTENRERLLKRKIVLKEAPAKLEDVYEKTEAEIVKEEKKERIQQTLASKSNALNYRQKRLWKKPGKKLPPAPKAETSSASDIAAQQREQAASAAGFYDEDYKY